MIVDVVESSDYEYCSYALQKKSCLDKHRFLIIIKHCPRFIQLFVFRKLLAYSFLRLDRGREIFFAFSNGYEMYGERELFLVFLEFLKKQYKNSKLGIYMYDAMQTDDAREFVSKYKEFFDIILTFNRYDSEEQGLEYYGPVNEAGIIEPKGEAEESDIFYAGGAGWARFDLIVDTFKYLSDHDKKCIFFIPTNPTINREYFSRVCKKLLFDVPYEEQYCFNYKKSKLYFNTYISYAWALSYILRTRVMLEIVLMPEGKASCTNRLAQAMAYEKKLLTNSEITKQENYYHPNNICVFSNPHDIDMLFFDKEFVPVNHDFSCVHMLRYMEERLFGKNE